MLSLRKANFVKATSARIASFGPYTLDLRSGELQKGGYRIKMGEQSFTILSMLLEKPGEMVTREELRAELWADDTFVDFDHGVNSAMQRVRDCLSDSAGKPRWVETVPRRGYRFVGQVEWSDEGSESEASTLDPEATRQAGLEARVFNGTGRADSHLDPRPWPPRRRLVFGLGLALALVALAALPAIRWIQQSQSKKRAERIRSIAVLPLENFSGDPSQEFFADGMTDELITMLAKNPALRITSRTSVMQYKHAHRPLPEIARELGVDGILEGSVGRTGNRVHVTAQLIHGPSDTHVWADSYDRDLSDIGSLQGELARAIAQQVGVTKAVFGQPEKSIRPEAHDAYLLGRYSWFAFETEKSQQYFQKAIDLQPDYAAAWSGLGDSLTLKAVLGEAVPSAVMPQAESSVRKALELDSSLAEAHNAMAAIDLFFSWNPSAAEEESVRAIELNPGLAEPHHLRAKILNVLNRTEEAVQEQRKAMELDPFARSWGMARAFLGARQYDAALQDARARSDSQPNNPDLHWMLCLGYRFKGMEKESVEEWKRALELQAQPALADALRRAFQSGGYRGALAWDLSLLKDRSKNGYVSPMEFAHAYAQLGRNDEAFRSLDAAYREHATGLVEIQFSPELDGLHGDPRYRALIKKIGLVPAS